MKIIDLLKTASGNMLQSKLRTFLTVIAVFIGALTLTLTNGIGAGISSYITQQVESIGAKDVLIIQPKTDTTAFDISDTPKKFDPEQANKTTSFKGISIPVLTESDIDVIKQVSGLSNVTAYKNVTASYIEHDSSGQYQISVVAYIRGTNLALKGGELPDNSSTVPQIELPYNYPSTLGFSSDEDAIGKEVTLGFATPNGSITTITATVVGVQEKTIISAGAANINNALLEKAYELQNEGLPGNSGNKFQAATATFDVNMSSENLIALKKSLNDKGYTAQTVDDTLGIIKSVISGIVIVFDLFGVIALLAASFGVINTLLMAVQERTKEIGLMKAMGMGGAKIFFLFSTEAVLLGFWGSFLGVLAAIGIGSVANSYATAHFLKDFEGLHLLVFPLHSIVIIMLVIMFITFLAGTLPARRASRLNPIDALRYE